MPALHAGQTPFRQEGRLNEDSIFYEDEAGECRWKVVTANGEIVADYADDYRHNSY